jgi:hypothetical protein
MFSRFVVHALKGTVSEFAREKQLPYSLIYNLAHRRIKSVSARDYERIFGEKPPDGQMKRVDGAYFRGMVRLWQFIHRDSKKKNLYEDFYPGKKAKRVDSRIFSGRIRTIERQLEKKMEKKFIDQGLQRPEIKRWIEELDQMGHKERVPYEAAKPALQYMERVVKIRPSGVLKQHVGRYESGALKTVSKERYHHILRLREKVRRISRSGSRVEMERLVEEVCGKRTGLTLFSEVKDELDFLGAYGAKGTKKYLGRSISHYRKAKLKRIATWRAQKIKEDCDKLVSKMTDIRLASLPQSVIPAKTAELISALKSCLVEKLIQDEDKTYERRILGAPSLDKEAFKKEVYGFTSMDHAASAFGMSKNAFDLMVAAHASIFRGIVRYDGRWYLSNLYIDALNREESFQIVKAKYACLAARARPTHGSHEETEEEPSSKDRRPSGVAFTDDGPDEMESGSGLRCPGLFDGLPAYNATSSNRYIGMAFIS